MDVSKVGCKGTSCNKIAARGLYQSGGGANSSEGAGSFSRHGVSTRTMKKIDTSRGGNNFPNTSSMIIKSKKLLIGGGRKTKKNHKNSKSKPMRDKKKLKRLMKKRTRRALLYTLVGGRGAKGYSHPKNKHSSKKHNTRNKKYLNHHAKKSMKVKKRYMKGGSGGMLPLKSTNVPSGSVNPPVARPNSNYYTIGNNPGEGGRLSTPIPYKPKPSCPL